MPGGGMTLALMKHFVRGGLMQRCSYLHHSCKDLELGVATVKEIIANPTDELELLWRLDIDTEDDPAVLKELQDWALNGLPMGFLNEARPEEVFLGEPNPIMAVVNCSRSGFTLRQELISERTNGFEAFSFDMWAAAPVSEQIADNESELDCLTLLYQLLSAGTLRRLGSPLLPIVRV